jgi:hypothetical protein
MLHHCFSVKTQLPGVILVRPTLSGVSLAKQANNRGCLVGYIFVLAAGGPTFQLFTCLQWFTPESATTHELVYLATVGRVKAN